MQFDRGLPLALFRHRPGADGGGAGGSRSCCSRDRKIGVAERPGSAAGAGGEVGPAAAGRRRRRRRRGPGHADRQPDPRHAEELRGQGAGLRRPAQGDAAGHRHPDRRPGDRRGARAQARERHACEQLGPRQAGGGRQGQHDASSAAAATQAASKAGSSRSAARSKRRPATTTGRSCRSGWPSWPAAWRSSASAPRPKRR